MTHDEMILVIRAERDGKEIQSKEIGYTEFSDCFQKGNFNFKDYEYRIKPEPRTWHCVVDSGALLVYHSEKRARAVAELGGDEYILVQEVLDDET